MADVIQDDYTADINTTGRLTVGGQLSGVLGVANDDDWFRVDLVAGTSYSFEGSGNLSGGTLSNLYLTLRGSNAITVGNAYGSDKIGITAMTSGTYYLSVKALGSVATGTYTVKAITQGNDDYTADIATTGRLTVGGQSTGTLGVANDDDWFRVDLVAGTSYSFEGSGNLSGGTLSNLYLTLRGSDGITVGNAYGSDKIGFTATTSGTYYLSVKALGSVATGTYTLKVNSSTSIPTLTLIADSVKEGGSGTVTLSYTAKLSEPTTTPVSFSIKTIGGTATAGSDYAEIDQTKTIAAGSTMATIEVPIVGDTNVEADETIVLTLSQVSGAQLANNATSITAVGTIQNDDLPTLTLSGGTMKEGTAGFATLSYTATLSEKATTPVSFTIKSTGGTATAGSDYAAIDRAVTIATGSTTATVEIPVVGDTNVEADETVILTLSQVSGAQLANNASSITATGTIQNDDVPTLTLTAGTVKEGASGTATLSYTATLSEKTTTPVSFTIKTTGGTATAGSDYAAIDRTVTIAAGSTSATIEIPVVGDTRVEADETVIITLSQLSGAQLANNASSVTATGTILNDDLPTLTLSADSVKEGASGTGTLSYTIRLSDAATKPITFTAKTTGGTASTGGDYTAIDQRATIAAGATSATIKVSVIGDTRIESNETVILTLSDINGAQLANNATSITATGTILNDDVGAAFILSAYKALNPDLVAAFGSDNAAYVRHYINSGKAEGRTSSGFDAEAYAALNPDLLNAFGLNETALANHYRTNGLAEGRVATGFDADAYAAMNPDLFAAFGTNHDALIRHYASNGKAEGRVATGFDVDAYAALNPDLFRAFGLNASSLINHYIQNGKAEGRSADGFDVDAYAALNPDLFAAFGLDQSALINHYINSGRAEGRAAMAPLVALGLPMEPDFVA